MKYFSRKTSLYTPKNKLQRAVLDQMDRYNGYIIDVSQVFTDDLKRLVARENEQYPGCKALTVRWWTIGSELFVDVLATGQLNAICRFELHRINGEFCPLTPVVQEGGSHV